MSELKMVGSCGILYAEDRNGDGPLAEMPAAVACDGRRFTMVRDDGEEFDLYREEVRDLLPFLAAFADGAS